MDITQKCRIVNLRARVAALEEALRRIRDYATPGYRNGASMELALDGIYKAADDTLTLAHRKPKSEKEPPDAGDNLTLEQKNDLWDGALKLSKNTTLMTIEAFYYLVKGFTSDFILAMHDYAIAHNITIERVASAFQGIEKDIVEGTDIGREPVGILGDGLMSRVDLRTARHTIVGSPVGLLKVDTDAILVSHLKLWEKYINLAAMMHSALGECEDVLNRAAEQHP